MEYHLYLKEKRTWTYLLSAPSLEKALYWASYEDGKYMVMKDTKRWYINIKHETNKET